MDGFICLPLSPFVPRCLPAWMPGTALWVDEFICLPLSPFICLPLSPSLDAWHGSLGGRVHLSPFVSLCPPLSPSLDAWHGSLGERVHLSPFVSLHLSPVVSQPGCLARRSLFICRYFPTWNTHIKNKRCSMQSSME